MFEGVIKAVPRALSHAKIRGFVVIEVNPNNDPDGKTVLHLVEGLIEGFEARAAQYIQLSGYVAQQALTRTAGRS